MVLLFRLSLVKETCRQTGQLQGLSTAVTLGQSRAMRHHRDDETVQDSEITSKGPEL